MLLPRRFRGGLDPTAQGVEVRVGVHLVATCGELVRNVTLGVRSVGVLDAVNVKPKEAVAARDRPVDLVVDVLSPGGLRANAHIEQLFHHLRIAGVNSDRPSLFEALRTKKLIAERHADDMDQRLIFLIGRGPGMEQRREVVFGGVSTERIGGGAADEGVVVLQLLADELGEIGRVARPFLPLGERLRQVESHERIFIGGELIGGFSELSALEFSGKLDERLGTH